MERLNVGGVMGYCECRVLVKEPMGTYECNVCGKVYIATEEEVADDKGE
jgi:hypothetical protein